MCIHNTSFVLKGPTGLFFFALKITFAFSLLVYYYIRILNEQIGGVMLDQITLNELYIDDGINLIHKERFTESAIKSNFNSKHAGNIVGCESAGYIKTKINGKYEGVHNILFTMRHGPIPDCLIVEHENNDGTDNADSNHRLATQSENMANRSVNKNKKSGLPKGVSHVTNSSSFRVRIGFKGKSYDLGTFTTLKAAVIARAAKAAELHGKFANKG